MYNNLSKTGYNNPKWIEEEAQDQVMNSNCWELTLGAF